MFKRLSLLLLILLLSVSVLAQDDEETAFVMFGHLAADAPAVDIFVDDELVLEDFSFSELTLFTDSATSDSVALPAGEYSIAVAPTGEGVEAAVIGPVDIELAAGREYLIAAVGTIEAETLDARVFDLTEISANADPAESGRWFHINYFSENITLDIAVDEETVVEGLEFGSAGSYTSPPAQFTEVVTAQVNDSAVPLSQVALPGSPYLSAVIVWLDGNVAFTLDSVGTTGDLLLGSEEPSITGLGYETFLTALDAAELTAILNDDGYYLFVVPTDTAFDELPEDALEALLDDTDALTDLLQYHVVDLTTLDDIPEPGEAVSLEVETLSGETLTYDGNPASASINGLPIVQYLSTSNGILVFVQEVLSAEADETEEATEEADE